MLQEETVDQTMSLFLINSYAIQFNYCIDIGVSITQPDSNALSVYLIVLNNSCFPWFTMYLSSMPLMSFSGENDMEITSKMNSY